MEEKVDLAKAEKARADGNVSFKKGRWVEAIGHYTASIVSNPRDAIPYSNRAAAYLKLDKYEDAERDCNSALELSKDHVKARYRRAMALKGLEKYDQALKDLERVLELEKNNEMALSEMDEIKDLLRIQEEKLEKRNRDRGKLPPSPPRTATIHEIHDVEETSMEPPPPPAATTTESKRETKDEDDEGIKVRSTSFADKKKSRLDRKTYISPAATLVENNPPSVKPSPPMNPPNGSAGSSTVPTPTEVKEPKVTPGPPPTTSTTGITPTTVRTSSSARAPIPPSDPTSTSPASGLNLLTQVSRLDAESTWTLLTFYPPSVIPTIVAPLLEPEQLGKILLGLKHGVKSDPQRVKTILEGLRRTSRWKINVAMLDTAEKQAGKKTWEAVGGKGQW